MAILEDHSIQPTMNLKIIGYYIKKERLKQNISLRSLAKYTGISPQFLSDIEHSKKKPANYAFKRLQEELYIEFYEEPIYYEKARELFSSIFAAYINLDLTNIKIIHEEIKKDEQIYRNSYGLLYVFLSDFIYGVAIDEAILLNIQELNEVENLLEHKDLLIFYTLSGYYFTKIGNLRFANEYFDKAIAISSISFTCENALLYSYLSIYYEMTNRLWDALETCERAILYFANLCVFKRVMINQIKKGDIYNLMDFHERAIRQYRFLLDKVFIDKDKIILYHNLAYCYAKLKKFDESMLYSKLALQSNEIFSETYFNIAYLYWKQNKYDECLQYISKHKLNKGIKKADRLFMQILQAHILGEKEEVYSYLTLVLTDLQGQYYQFVYTPFFYLDIAIDLYTYYKDYERVVKTYEQKECFLPHRS